MAEKLKLYHLIKEEHKKQFRKTNVRMKSQSSKYEIIAVIQRNVKAKCRSFAGRKPGNRALNYLNMDNEIKNE